MGLGQDRGILVQWVEADSPALLAGVRQSDILVSFRRARILAVDDLHRLLTRGTIGTEQPLALVHGEELWEAVIHPTELRFEQAVASPPAMVPQHRAGRSSPS